LVFGLTFFFGYQMWKFSVPIFGLRIPGGAVFELLMYIGSLGLTLPMALWNVYV
jgi:hypothetical protein